MSPDGTPKWTHEHEHKHIAMKKPKVVSLAEENSLFRVGHGSLMDRVVSILEQARTNVARSVNSNMVIAYWLVGREIVVALQGGEERAEYGERLLGDLSEQLTKRYGRGFSVTNLRYFRLFYQVFSDRAPEIHHSSSDELGPLTQDTVLNDLTTALDTTNQRKGFSPNLSWTHYRALSKIEQRPERLFYEIETEKAGWSVSLLEEADSQFPVCPPAKESRQSRRDCLGGAGPDRQPADRCNQTALRARLPEPPGSDATP